MTDKEIIQALECCKMPVGSGSCNDCPFDYQREKRLTSTDESCTTLMLDYALDLINRQQAEIERLQAYHDDMESAIYQFREEHAKVKFFKGEIRAEAIKEFAERLKELKEMPLITNNDIDNLVKEMVGVDW